MCFAWQGWRASIPGSWNPQRLEGNFDAGYALLSDLNGPRLGLRWSRVGSRAKVSDLVDRAMQDEVGQLAAEESADGSLEGFDCVRQFVEPNPPGRDLWIGYSRASARIAVISLQRQRGESSRLPTLVQTFKDETGSERQPWAVFDLNCQIGSNWRLASKVLNAGDLSLCFRRGRDQLICRQLALASLALKRRPIDRWLREISSPQRMQYAHSDEAIAHELETPDGRVLKGITAKLARKAWLRWAWHLPQEWAFAVYHDAARDRLILGQSTQASELELLCSSCGSVR